MTNKGRINVLKIVLLQLLEMLLMVKVPRNVSNVKIRTSLPVFHPLGAFASAKYKLSQELLCIIRDKALDNLLRLSDIVYIVSLEPH